MPQTIVIEDLALEGSRLRIVRMDRPDARNAMNTQMLTELADALTDTEAEDDVCGLLLTGTGGTFSAGADIKEDGDPARRMELFTTVYELLSNFRLPTAAAIEGSAIGGGAEAASACDIRIAGEGVRFRFPGAIYGIPVGPARLVGLVGLGTAKDWVLSSRDVSAEEAARVAFVQQVVPDGETEAAARAWLELVASRQRGTVLLQKRLLNDFAGVRDRVAFENDALRAQAELGELPPGLDVDLPRTVRPRRR